jgi:hypothetical protein
VAFRSHLRSFNCSFLYLTLPGPLLLFYNFPSENALERFAGGVMSRFRGNGQLTRFLRLLGLGAGCLALANCANSNMSSRIDSNSIADVRHEHHQKIRTADRALIQYVADTTNNDSRATVVGSRPTDCPRSFCGCEASRYLFGHVRADLNLASNWMRKFPRTSPAPGMAAVRNHHVFVLMSHVDGNNWLVHDGNSGHGLTREHVRSISGYAVVNPQGTGIATPVLARAE